MNRRKKTLFLKILNNIIISAYFNNKFIKIIIIVVNIIGIICYILLYLYLIINILIYEEKVSQFN